MITTTTNAVRIQEKHNINNTDCGNYKNTNGIIYSHTCKCIIHNRIKRYAYERSRMKNEWNNSTDVKEYLKLKICCIKKTILLFVQFVLLSHIMVKKRLYIQNVLKEKYVFRNITFVYKLELIRLRKNYISNV